MTTPLPEPASARECRRPPSLRGAVLIGGLVLAMLGALFFATTRGDQPPSQVAIGGVAAGPGRFLASGHPAPGTDQPAHLGVIESRDAAGSWE